MCSRPGNVGNCEVRSNPQQHAGTGAFSKNPKLETVGGFVSDGDVVDRPTGFPVSQFDRCEPGAIAA